MNQWRSTDGRYRLTMDLSADEFALEMIDNRTARVWNPVITRAAFDKAAGGYPAALFTRNRIAAIQTAQRWQETDGENHIKAPEFIPEGDA